MFGKNEWAETCEAEPRLLEYVVDGALRPVRAMTEAETRAHELKRYLDACHALAGAQNDARAGTASARLAAPRSAVQRTAAARDLAGGVRSTVVIGGKHGE